LPTTARTAPRRRHALALGGALLAVAALLGCQRQPTQPDAGATFSVQSEQVLRAFRDAGIPGAPTAIKPAGDGFLYAEVDSQPVFFRVEGERVYMLSGTLSRVEAGHATNMSEQRVLERNRRLLADARLAPSLTYPATAARRARVLVFTDPSCSYCRAFHSQLATINAAGIEVAYLAMPREGLTSRPAAVLRSAACAGARGVLDQAFARGLDAIPQAACDDGGVVAANAALASRLGVAGTPAIFLESGEQVGGYLSAKDLIAVIDKDA